MTDSMKFGPEWLRNLSADGSPAITSTTRYHLAEHRYGREEMLALFEQSLKIRPPASMMNFTSLYVDQALNPLALAPMTEDENRLWSSRTVVGGGGTRGRGGSLERGRGRGRGGTFHAGFSRSTSSYDEPLRSYERSQSDRGWPERNGDMSGDWGGSSPRKEYGSSRGGSTVQDNWRRHRDSSADEDGWRSSSQHMNRDKWSGPGSGSGSRSSGNWRSEAERTVDDRETARGSGWHGPPDHNRTQPHRRHWDAEDHLPEWANEIPSESGGTFDASGAFHGSDDELNDRPRNRSREQPPLHKSASQHNITSPKKPPPLATSQSAVNLAKPVPSNTTEEPTIEHLKKDTFPSPNENVIQTLKPPTPPTVQPEPEPQLEEEKPPEKEIDINLAQHKIETRAVEHTEQKKNINSRVINEEFDQMKEVTDDSRLDDIVAKLILDDDALPKRSDVGYGGLTLGSTTIPPPGTGADKWFYRDPQGETQGPFSAQEMTDWYRAGYFTVGLLVRRQCDERYFMLGELVKQCPGGAPFLTCRLPPLKSEPTIPLSKASEQDAILQHQLQLKRYLQTEVIQALSQTEPWSQLSNLQQRELISQHMLQAKILPDVPYVPQMQNTQLSNPIMHMINQIQQANKLPTQPPMVEKPPNTVPTNQLNPIQQLVQQMGGLPPNISPIVPNIPNMESTSAPDSPNIPIKNLLRQLSSKTPTIESLWPGVAAPYQASLAPQPQQWPTQTLPTALWDYAVPQSVMAQQQQTPTTPPPPPPPSQPEPTLPATAQEPSSTNTEQIEKEVARKAEAEQKEAKARERKEMAEKEKRKKELEQEKLKAQKEAEEKRKEEQRKKEAEKKAEAERQRREEERVRKEIEKAKKEAEEKRQKELEEKRRLKEQRKAEEEARRKLEEEKQRQEEEAAKRKQEEERQRQKEEVGRRQQEALRKMQEQQRVSKVAPWASIPGTGGSTGGSTVTQPASLSLAEIQRIEREKKAEQAAAIAQQQRALAAAREALEQQQQQERQLGWAVKKSAQPKKVKSLAEIQAEEQEKLQRQQAEQRLREQSTPASSVTASASAGIWGTASQNLTWASNQQQWQHASGFWDESLIQQKPLYSIKQQPQPASTKQVITTKPNTPATITATITTTTTTTTTTTVKSKAKKEEQQVMKHFDKSAANDEFSTWCTKTLTSLNGDVDIPTFISFLRDIESPYEVKDYVRQYLGDSAPAAHFANQFVERRSKARERQRAANQHKDDLNTPAPAVNPASSEFQEVKGKGKKSKKSKMVKLDNRALGFNVIAAQDRINVGDRDYGDNL